MPTGYVAKATVLVVTSALLAGCAALEPSPDRLARVRYYLWHDFTSAGSDAYERRELGKAIGYFQQALEVAELQKRDTGRPEADEMVATSHKNLGFIYSKQQHHGDAESHYLHALSIRERVVGPDSTGVSDVLNDLATVYRSQGRLDEARPLYDRAARIYEQAELAPRRAMVLNNIGHVETAQGRLLEAESSFLRALQITETAVGPNPAADHPGFLQLIQQLRDYAASVRFADRLDEADALDQRAGELLRQIETHMERAEAHRIEARLTEILSHSHATPGG
jgi:tetratricopeptide (TPR) repeat protein